MGTEINIAGQAKLISGTNIKTINGNSVLGSGDLTISGGVSSVTADYPMYSTGGVNPHLTILQCDGTQDGYITGGDYQFFANKQEALVSGTNIKTINGNSVVGSGNLNTFALVPTQTVASSSTVTPTSANQLVVITAQAVALTLAAPTGTFVQGQSLMIRIKDNGTARTIFWSSGTNGYRAIGVSLPTTTVANKTTYVGCIYNSTDSIWDVIGVTTQA
jgi:hypothetical protein